MITYRSFVGLDVHARTVVGCAIDDQTGEVVYRRFGYDLAEVLAWVDSLPGPQTAVSPASVMGPRRCHEYGTTWMSVSIAGLAFGVKAGALVESVSLLVGGSFDDQGVCA